VYIEERVISKRFGLNKTWILSECTTANRTNDFSLISVVGAAVVVGVAVDVGNGVDGAEVGTMVDEQGPTTSQACCHAPPYTVEKGSYPTWLHSLSRVGIAAVDLHLKICPFIDTKLPAT
jgi:hypothetical protein